MRTELLNWLKNATDEDVKKTGTSVAYLKQIAYGNKKASASLAVKVEIASNAKITRAMLRPDDWHEIWPEIAA